MMDEADSPQLYGGAGEPPAFDVPPAAAAQPLPGGGGAAHFDAAAPPPGRSTKGVPPPPPGPPGSSKGLPPPPGGMRRNTGSPATGGLPPPGFGAGAPVPVPAVGGIGRLDDNGDAGAAAAALQARADAQFRQQMEDAKAHASADAELARDRAAMFASDAGAKAGGFASQAQERGQAAAAYGEEQAAGAYAAGAGAYAAGAGAAGGAAAEQVAALQRQLQQAQDQLSKQSQEIRHLRMLAPPEPNFPRKCFCITPQVYHNIAADAAADRQSFLKTLYAVYYINCVLLVAQFVCSLFAAMGDSKNADDDDSDWMGHLGFSTLYLIGIPGAFIVWYWPAYIAMTQHNLMRFRIAHLGFFMAWAYSAVMALGIEGHGGSGFMFAFLVFDKKKSGGAGIFAIVLAFCWALLAVFFVCHGFRLNRWYKKDRDSPSGKLQLAAEQAATAAAVAKYGGGGGAGGAK